MKTSGSFDLAKERAKKPIINFLGEYDVPLTISQDIRMQIKQFVSGSELVTSYQIDYIDQFRQIVKFALLSFGLLFRKENRPFNFIKYKVCECYRDITEAYLNPDSDNESGARLVNSLCELDLLILYCPRVSIKNKKTWELCFSIAESRKFLNRKTIFITCKPESEIDDYLKPVNLSTPLRNSTNGQLKMNVGDIYELPDY
jgi:hypothetical protein